MAAALTELTVYQNRSTDHKGIAITEPDGTTTIKIAATDKIRFKMGRNDGNALILDLLDGTANANGSKVTLTSAVDADGVIDIRFGQADIAALTPGVYRGDLMVIDDSETEPSDAAKPAQSFVIYVIAGFGGSLGLT